MKNRKHRMVICAIGICIGSMSIAEMTLSELTVMQINMFGKDPCLDLMVLQDNFSNSNTTEFEKVKLWHSYVTAIGDSKFSEREDRFAYAMGWLATECFKQPTLPMSEIVQRSPS